MNIIITVEFYVPFLPQKAIQESESEWNQNKKLVDLSGRDVRRAVPKGFPYFAVDFGSSPGYAHVIEDEVLFPQYFGQVRRDSLDAAGVLYRWCILLESNAGNSGMLNMTGSI